MLFKAYDKETHNVFQCKYMQMYMLFLFICIKLIKANLKNIKTEVSENNFQLRHQ